MFENLLKKQYYKEGKGKPAPTRGMANYFYLLSTHFWKFVILNFLFLLFSVPIVTLPAALVSLNRVCIDLVRKRNTFVWEVFWDEFKRTFIKSLPLGLLYIVLLFCSYYLLSLGISNGEKIDGIIFSAMGLILLLLVMVWGGYTFILQAMLELSNKNILKNAFFMIMLDVKNALWFSLTLLSAVLIAVLLFPVSIILMVFCLFSLTQYTLCYFVNTPVQKWIIAPYEAIKTDKEETM